MSKACSFVIVGMSDASDTEDQSAEAKLLLTVHPWELYITNTRDIYFFNLETEATQWDLPEELQGNKQIISLVENQGVVSAAQEIPTHESGSADESQAADEDGWAEAVDAASGKVTSSLTELAARQSSAQPLHGVRQVYWWNASTGETTWECPKELAEPASEEQMQVDPRNEEDPNAVKRAGEDRQIRVVQGQAEDDGQIPANESEGQEWSTMHQQGTQDASDAAAGLQAAKAILDTEDSLMDPSIVATVLSYLQYRGQLQSKGAATKELNPIDHIVAAYRGYANMSKMLARWYHCWDTVTDQDLVGADADQLILEHLGGQAKSNFNLEKADRLLLGTKQDMAFIDDMMKCKRWRRLLMELFAQHRDSKLLSGYCTQHMSRVGHNTEMAKIIPVTEYWGVARGVIIETLMAVPWADYIKLQELFSTLTRVCCSTSHTYGLAQKILHALEESLLGAAASKLQPHTSEQDVISRAQTYIEAARKFRRLRQELEQEGQAKDHRRNFVCELSCPGRSVGNDGDPKNLAEEDSRKAVRQTLLAILKTRRISEQELDVLSKHCIHPVLFREKQRQNVPSLDLGAAEQGLGLSDNEDEDVVADIGTVHDLLCHPMLLRILVEAVFDPKLRLTTAEERRKVCKLLSVASSALPCGRVQKDDVQILYTQLFQSCELLADEKTLHWNMSVSSVPPTLKSLLRQPVIVMGYLHWLRVTIEDPEFHNSRQFNEVMQVFLRLLQFVTVDRPLHHPAVFASLKALLMLKPTESSSSILQMKRQALQCCILLMSQGFVLPVLDLLQRLGKGMDLALLRHFVGSALAVARPPYSPEFAQATSNLLRCSFVTKAMAASMAEDWGNGLRTFLDECCSKNTVLIDEQSRRGLRLAYPIKNAQ